MSSFEVVVETVVAALRDITPRETVELGVLHGFCVDAAREAYPHLVMFLSSVEGLNAFTAHLYRLTAVIEAVDVTGSTWRFL